MATRKKKNNIGAFGHPIYGKGFAKYGEMRPNGSSEIPKDLEEAAEEYAKLDEEGKWKDGGKYKGFITGAKWDRSQILKEAVEGEVIVPIYEGDDAWSAEIKIPGRYEIGDKVRIIILKEDEK